MVERSNGCGQGTTDVIDLYMHSRRCCNKEMRESETDNRGEERR